MKVLKYIPLLLLASCTSTKVTDQSKHYANYQSYTISHNDSPKQPQKASDEVLYRQSSDEEYLNDTRTSRNKRDNRTYNVQNYYENSGPTPDFTQILPNERSRTADTVQHLPPNLFFRPGEFNPFKNF
jgi:hypothetical protein